MVKGKRDLGKKFFSILWEGPEALEALRVVFRFPKVNAIIQLLKRWVDDENSLEGKTLETCFQGEIYVLRSVLSYVLNSSATVKENHVPPALTHIPGAQFWPAKRTACVF